MFKAMGSMCLQFVLMAEGMELNKVNIHKLYKVLHVTSPHRLGGWGCTNCSGPTTRFITMVQNTFRSRLGSIGCDLSKELLSRAVPIRNYLAILTQLGARTALHIALLPRPAGGSLTAKAPMTASSCEPAKNRWGMPSPRVTTLPHTGATKTPQRARHNVQEHEQIRRNGEVDLLAKMATRLPVPDYDPRRPEDIAICGGPTPTPARKWILPRRRVVTFDGVHWVSWPPMRGDRRMLWVKWL